MRFTNSQVPVSSLNGAGNSTTIQLKKLGIESVYSLLLHFPYRYADFSKISKISNLKIGEPATIKGVIKSAKLKKLKGRKSILEVYIFDGSGYLAGTWFNQSYLSNIFKEGATVFFSGRIDYKYGKIQINNPIYEFDQMIDTGKIVAIHPLTASLFDKKLKNLIRQALNDYDIEEILPQNLIKRERLMDRQEAFNQIHFPESIEKIKKSRYRLKFEELFLLQCALLSKKKKYHIGQAFEFKNNDVLISQGVSKLGYKLTSDQEKAINEIKSDLMRNEPMNRLLQGEVGSGKTTVAFLAILMAVENGYQAALMAPTEILATQHYLKFKQLLEGLPLKITLLVGSLSEKDKKQIKDELKKGDINIAIGTHALIQKDANFKKLGLAIIDEQHRFGVLQRADLKEDYTNTLVMTATPIPRTLALTCYSDLDISTIKELPGGKKLDENISTLVVKNDKRQKAYEKIKKEIGAGRQAYIICPLIEESDSIQVKAVMAEANYLENTIFKNYRVGLLHGKLKSSEKELIMDSFRNGHIDILISTTVVEVGIDVGNATVMLIENAERFGLSQLHQLRGRIGRGKYPSFCIVFANLDNEETKRRMAAFKKLSNGFDLAEADLQLRGEGQIIGTRQSGYGDLRLIRLTRDIELIQKVKNISKQYVDENEISQEILNEISCRFPTLGLVFQG